MNVILIICDAMRRQEIGVYGYHKNTTPNIDILAREGMLFTKAYSCSDQTDPSLTTIASSRYPMSHGVLTHGVEYWKENINALNRNKVLFISEVLKNNGYKTGAIDWLGRWHKRGYDFYSERPSKSKEFNVVKDMIRRSNVLYKLISKIYRRICPMPTSIIDNAEIVTKKALEVIDRWSNKKFFLLIHYWDTHIPFSPPKSFFEKFRNEGDTPLEKIINKIENKQWKEYTLRWTKNIKTYEELVSLYEASLAFVDYNVGLLMDFLNKKRLTDTILIITADHGQSIAEHKILDHSGLYEEIIHIPLILYTNTIVKSRVDKLVQHVDIAPTILELLDIYHEEYIELSDGKSLLDLKKNGRNYAFSVTKNEFSVVSKEGFKYIYNYQNGKKEFYDINNDPSENINKIEKYPELAKKFHLIFNEFSKKIKRKKLKRDIRKIKKILK